MSSKLKDWYNSPELAGLPGLPSSEFRLREKAKREAWKTRLRDAKGGGYEYHIESLPLPTRAYLLKQSLPKIQLDPPKLDKEKFNRRMAGMAKYATLAQNDERKLRADVRSKVLRMLRDFQKQTGTKKREMFAAFVDAIKTNALPFDDELLKWMPKNKLPSAATLKKWFYDFEKDGSWGLVDQYGNRKGHSKVNDVENLGDIITGLMLKEPHARPKYVLDYLKANHPEKVVVCETTVKRYMEAYKRDNHQIWTYMTDPDRWKNEYMVAFGSQHERVEYINHIWELDSTPGDWMLTDGRHSVVGVIDLWSRRLMLHVSKTSSAQAVCTAFRKSALAWGIAEICRTDNGKDYVSDQFMDALIALKIDQELCVPFASEEKATIERAFQTMSHSFLEMLPGFIGHNVAERKVIESRKSFADRIMTKGDVVEVSMSSDELQEKLDQWCQIYHNTPHSGLDGKTPNEMVAENTRTIKRIKDERALDMLLAPVVEKRIVSKKGIKLDYHDYAHPALHEYVKEEVSLRYDENDLGRMYVYQGETFICVAECPELLGYSRQELAVASKSAQKKLAAELSKEQKAKKRSIKENPAETIIAHRIAEAENITVLQRSETYSTPALEQAGFAARADEMPQQTDEQKTESQRLRDEFLKEWNETQPMQETSKPRLAVMPLAPVEESDNPKRRHARWLRLDKRVEAGERLTADEQKFHKRYPLSSDYQSMKQFFEDFGLDESSAG